MIARTHDASKPRRLSLIAAALVLCAAVAIVVAAVAAFRYLQPATTRDYGDAVFQRRAVTLAGGVHLLGEMAPAAVYVVETSRGLVLIDSGAEASAARVAGQLSELGFAVNDVSYILITHVHADHSLGARRLRELTGAKVCAGAGDLHELEAGGPPEAFFSTFHMPGVQTHGTKIDHVLDDGELLDLGDAKIRCIATPGHTPGSMCYLLERDNERILFAGDTIVSLTSRMGTYSAYLPPRYRGNAEDYLSSLKRLRALPNPDLILPGHPRFDRTGQSPRLDEHAWQELLDHGIGEMQELVGRFRDDGYDFLDGHPKSILPGLFYLGDYHDWAIYGLLAADHLFVFDAPGGPGLAEFLHERLVRLKVKAPAEMTVLLTAHDQAATAGLPDLVNARGCRVVAPKKALAELRERCPPGTRFLPRESLQEQSWFPVKLWPLNGLGESPAAYEITWANKNVLVSGRIPIYISGFPRDSLTAERLLDDLASPVGDANRYLNSLDALQTIKPEIWLPARPVHGQNANLYATQWKDTLQGNRDAIRTAYQ